MSLTRKNTGPVAYLPPSGLTGAPDWFWDFLFDYFGITGDVGITGTIFPGPSGPTISTGITLGLTGPSF